MAVRRTKAVWQGDDGSLQSGWVERDTSSGEIVNASDGYPHWSGAKKSTSTSTTKAPTASTGTQSSKDAWSLPLASTSPQTLAPLAQMVPDRHSSQTLPRYSSQMDAAIRLIPGYTPQLPDAEKFDFKLGDTEGFRTASELLGSMQSFAEERLQNPGRYDNSLVQQGLSTIDQELSRQREGAHRRQSELLSGRGLVGSTFEADFARQLEADFEAQRSRFAFDLARDQAATNAQDIAAASQTAGQVADFARAMGMDDWNTQYQALRAFEDDLRARATEAQYAHQVQVDQNRFAEEDKRFRESIDQFEFQSKIQSMRALEDDIRARAELGLTAKELAQRGHALLDDTELRRQAILVDALRFLKGGDRAKIEDGFSATDEQRGLITT